jgi:hypothetical protein
MLWLFARLESALNESAKALAQAAEQSEADHVAMSKAISAFCQVFGLDDVPSGSSPKSRLQALGDHARDRLREALHHGVRRAFAVLASHYDMDLERVSEGYCLPDEDEVALVEVQRLDAAAAGPSGGVGIHFRGGDPSACAAVRGRGGSRRGWKRSRGCSSSPGRFLILPEQFILNMYVSFAAVEA